jgi:release factor glutamine methyltransferase
VTTLSEAKSHIVRELEAAGIELQEVRREAELICEHATGWTLSQQILNAESPVPIEAMRVILDIVERRKKRIPLQYLFGYAYFMGLKLTVRPGVLIPREDTETLVLTVLDYLAARPTCHLCDIGIGSGAISIAVLERRGSATITGIDISADAVVLTRENALLHGVHDRLTIIHDDWEASLPGDLDGIVSNPPYIPSGERGQLLPEVADHEPPEALFGRGRDGLDFYRKLSKVGQGFLKTDGFFAVEVGDKQAHAVRDIFAEHGWRNLRVDRDLNGIERVVSGLRPV